MAKAKKKEEPQDVQDETTAAGEPTEQIEDAALALDTRTMVGDIRDFLLDRLKHNKEGKPWAQLSESQQSDDIYAATSAAENLVRNAVDLVATQGFNHAKAEIDSWKVKGKQVVINLKAFASEETLLSLLNAGSVVTLTFANDDAFDQGRSECKPQPDQPGLALDGTNDENAEDAETGTDGDDDAEGGDDSESGE